MRQRSFRRRHDRGLRRHRAKGRLDDLFRIRRAVDRMLELPAMLEWEEAALADSYRELGHEVELGRAGTILEDFRSVPA